VKNIDWVVIHIAHSESAADKLAARLSDEGFLARVRPRTQLNIWELTVTRSESVPARDYLMEILHEEDI